MLLKWQTRRTYQHALKLGYTAGILDRYLIIYLESIWASRPKKSADTPFEDHPTGYTLTSQFNVINAAVEIDEKVQVRYWDNTKFNYLISSTLLMIRNAGW